VTEDALAAAARELETRTPKAAKAAGQVILLIPMALGFVVGFLLAMRGDEERRLSKLIIIAGAMVGFGLGVVCFQVFKRLRRAALVPEIARRHGVTEEALRTASRT
jgi:hypothetical protein